MSVQVSPVLTAMFCGLFVLWLTPAVLLRLPAQRWWAQLLAIFATVVSLGALGFAAFVVDDLMSSPYSLIFCVSVIVLAAAVNLPLIRHFRSRLGLGLVATFCVVAVVWHLHDSETKAFKRLYSDIHNGMSESEVHAAMQKEYRSGLFAQPGFQRGINNGDYIEYLLGDGPGDYLAFITVKLKDGHVIGKDYSND